MYFRKVFRLVYLLRYVTSYVGASIAKYLYDSYLSTRDENGFYCGAAVFLLRVCFVSTMQFYSVLGNLFGRVRGFIEVGLFVFII